MSSDRSRIRATSSSRPDRSSTGQTPCEGTTSTRRPSSGSWESESARPTDELAHQPVRPAGVLELRYVAAVVEDDGARRRQRPLDVRCESARDELVLVAPEEEGGARECGEALPEPRLAVRLLEVDLTRGREEGDPAARRREDARELVGGGVVPRVAQTLRARKHH